MNGRGVWDKKNTLRDCKNSSCLSSGISVSHSLTVRIAVSYLLKHHRSCILFNISLLQWIFFWLVANLL